VEEVGGLQLVLTIDDDAVQAFLKLHGGGSFEEVKALEDCDGLCIPLKAEP
jgi:hypothetical protein